MGNFFKQNKIKIIILVPVVAVCYILAHDAFIGFILTLVTLYAVAASGLDILFGYSGQISLGHAGFLALGAYTSAILTTRLHWPPIIGIGAGCVIAMIFGVIIAFPASKLVKHFLSLMTIAFGQMVYMFVNSTARLTGGAGGISGIPPLSLFGLKLTRRYHYFLLSVVVLFIILMIKNRLIHSRTGRALIAIRENVQAAQGLGINVRNYKVLAFAISSFLAGLSGALLAHLVGFISPETFNAAQSIFFMTILLFGGIGSLAGPIVGAMALIFIREFFQSFATYQILVYGIFILIVLFFFPHGMIGIYNTLKKNIMSRFMGRNKKCSS